MSASSSSDPQAAGKDATVTLLSYGDLVDKSGGVLVAHPFVNPQRCVYLVTVHAPFTPDSPTGAKAPTYSTYNVVVDEATGVEITLHAGEDLTASVGEK